MELFFYATAGCHLCDEALAIWNDLHAKDWSLVEVDIADDDSLVLEYGERIPVFKRLDSSKELSWPFSHHDLQAFLIK